MPVAMPCGRACRSDDRCKVGSVFCSPVEMPESSDARCSAFRLGAALFLFGAALFLFGLFERYGTYSELYVVISVIIYIIIACYRKI